jgi:hypothetical protein
MAVLCRVAMAAGSQLASKPIEAFNSIDRIGCSSDWIYQDALHINTNRIYIKTRLAPNSMNFMMLTDAGSNSYREILVNE